jgi:PAS domain S-box-containing protein
LAFGGLWYPRPGGRALRILIAGESVADATRIEALVAACGFEAPGTRCEPLGRLSAVVAEGEAWDVLVAACPQDPSRLRAALDATEARQRSFSIVLLAPELTEQVAILAHGMGAQVCLLAHGPAPLRLAVLHAAQQAAERREREESLRGSELVRALIHVSVTDVIFHLRVEGERFRFVEVNPAFTKATGLSEDQIVGKLVDEIVPEPSLSLVLSKYREAIAERRTVRWEEVTEYPTGKKYGEVSITPVVGADGRCTRLLGTVHDVTEARQRDETIRLYADIVRSVQIGLTVWSAPDPDDPGTITLVAFNPQAERAAGVDLAEHVGRPIVEISPAARTNGLLDILCDVARHGAVRELGALRSRRDRPRTYAVKGFPLPGKCVGLAVEDVSVRARAQALSALEQRVLEMVASGMALRDVLRTLVELIEEQMPSAIASVLLLSPDGTRLLHGAAPGLPADYNRAIDGAKIGPKAGSCGTAAALGRPVIVSDIELDPLWDDYRELARQFGLRACWSTPITAASGRVLGTFALYYRVPRSPLPEDLELIGRICHVAGIAIQRHELDEQLRELSAHIDAAREEERTGIAREIHDQLGQALTAQKMDLAWIRRRVSSVEGLSREALLDRLERLMQTSDEVIHEVRRISAELRPAVLDDLGLDAALSWAAQEFERRTQIVCVVQSGLADEEKLDRAVTTAVFRVFQEALTNVVRHAAAKRVDVRIEESDGSLTLRVCDDGRGITTEQVQDPRSLGLLGMRERARRLGGDATFARAEPSGTVVTVRVPLHSSSLSV